MAILPPLASNVPIHHGLSNDVLSEFDYSSEARAFIDEVQKVIDSRFSGYKNQQNLYLHHIDETFGYKEGVDALIQEMYASVKVEISNLLRGKRGCSAEDNETFSKILFILGVLHHKAQDYKHREDNWTADESDPINSLEHFTTEIHQFFTDIWPSDEDQRKARHRTVEETDSFERWFKYKFGVDRGEDFLRCLKRWKPAYGKEIKDYLPSHQWFYRVFPSGTFRDVGPIG